VACALPGLQYDVDIAFSRRHPFEPPKVSFPDTALNRANPQHPLVDIGGVLRTEFLSFQAWLPTCGALEVLQHVRELFSSHSFMEGADAQPALLNLPTEALHRILRFLSVEGTVACRRRSFVAL
jgi:ubiquitin-protein ligase